MALAYINLSSKQYFNFMCRTDFERSIFHNTYREFQKKSKPYCQNQTLHTFSQMLNDNDKAISLHQKLHYSVMKEIALLENKIPVLNDEQDKAILFDFAEFHIHASDLKNKGGHVVSITYTSPKLVLHEMVGDLLILSYHSKNTFNETFMVKITDELFINYEMNPHLAYS